MKGSTRLTKLPTGNSEEPLFRTEPATNDVNDYGVKKAVENLPELRQRMDSITDNYLNVQQDILEPLSTADNCGNWPNPPSCPTESGSQVSSSITRDNWRSCILSCASPILLPAAALPLLTSTPQLWRLSA